MQFIKLEYFLNLNPQLISIILRFSPIQSKTKIPFIKTEQKCTSHKISIIINLTKVNKHC
jgi:hypothetical protein